MAHAARRLAVVLLAVAAAAAGAQTPAAENDALLDAVLRGLRDGANLKAFGKEHSLSPSKAWVEVKKEEVKDPQALLDELLRRLPAETHPSAVVGGGLLAVELDRTLGKKKDNQLKLVECLAEQLSSRHDTCRFFALRSLTDSHFPDGVVFSPKARNAIYRAAAQPGLARAFSDIDAADRSFILLVAKAGNTARARKLLERIHKANPNLGLLCRAALAKMGVDSQQSRLLADFRKATGLKDKYRYAYALSYWGGRKAQEALAEALRTPGMVKAWPNPTRPPEMIALHIAIALVRTIREDRHELPWRGCFAWTEEDLIQIEKWAEKHLGTKWSVPRPKYEPVKAIRF